MNKSVQAELDTTPSEPSSEHQTEHIGDLSCKKGCQFYNTYIKLNDAQTQSFSMAMISQSESEVRHNSRKLKITDSSAHKVPVRDTTNSDNFIREHLYPYFKKGTNLLSMEKRVKLLQNNNCVHQDRI